MYKFNTILISIRETNSVTTNNPNPLGPDSVQSVGAAEAVSWAIGHNAWMGHHSDL